MNKQLTLMSNPTIPKNLSGKLQNQLTKYYPANLRKRKYLQIGKITIGSI